jgi:hypothetical protein
MRTLAFTALLALAGCAATMPTPTPVPAVVLADPPPVPQHVIITVETPPPPVPEVTCAAPSKSPIAITLHSCPGYAACLSTDELAAVENLKADDDYLRTHCRPVRHHR